MKKTLSLLLALLLLLPAAACGEEKAAPKQLINAEGLVYIVAENGSAEIVGYTGKKEKLVIPETLEGHPVTVIAQNAFNSAGFAEVTVPGGIRQIRNSAFAACNNLTTVRLAEGLEILGSGAFQSCGKLKSINLPDTLKYIDDRIFSDCRELASVTISSGHPLLEVVDGVLFDRQEKRLIWYPATKKDETYAVPEGTRIIGAESFHLPPVTAVTLPDSVEQIRMSAFSNCPYLEKINIPAKVTELDGVFPGYGKITDIEVSPDNQVFCTRDGVLFDRGKDKLVLFPSGRGDEHYEIPEGTLAIESGAFIRAKLTEIVIPGSVREIGADAFFCCEQLASVTISEGVEKFGNRTFWYCNGLKEIRLPRSLAKVGENPFRECENLRRIIVDEDHPAFAVMDDALVSLEDMQLVWYPMSAERKKYTVPKGVRIIGSGAFYNCGQLTEIILPEGVEQLKGYVFSGCINLKQIVLPKSLTEISRGSFFSGKARTDLIPVTYNVVKGSYADDFCKAYKLKIKYHK